MLLFADENFPKRMVEILRSSGSNVRWARTDCSGWRDAALIDFAESEGRTVLTLDEDFWQIAVQRPVPLEQSGVVLFRLHSATPKSLEPLVHAFIEADKVDRTRQHHRHKRNSDVGHSKEMIRLRNTPASTQCGSI